MGFTHNGNSLFICLNKGRHIVSGDLYDRNSWSYGCLGFCSVLINPGSTDAAAIGITKGRSTGVYQNGTSVSILVNNERQTISDCICWWWFDAL